ncbi:MAG: hypothetical protein ACOYL3_17165 [Desulfuromonadaceae bacterium]
MFATTRKYQFNPNASGEIEKHVQDGLIPLLRQTPGFVAYYWVDSADGKGISLSVFENESGADESVRLASDYVKKHLAAIMGTPEVIKGEVRGHS